MCFCTIIYPIIFAAHEFTLESHCTRTVQSIEGRLQSMRAHTILLWFTMIDSMSYFFTVINFHDVFSCNNHLGIVVHSGSIGAFKF